ncbi:MAG: hypothetical protein ABIA74_06065 [bacterium]
MKNKYKLLMSVLVISFLMVGFVSAGVSSGSALTTSVKQTDFLKFDIGYDCYHQPGVYPWTNCKQVEHKRSWFEKKDFTIVGWRWISCDVSGCIYSYIWLRPAKL